MITRVHEPSTVCWPRAPRGYVISTRQSFLQRSSRPRRGKTTARVVPARICCNENAVVSICEALEHDCTVSRVSPNHRDNPIANPLYVYMYTHTHTYYVHETLCPCIFFASVAARGALFNHFKGVQILKYDLRFYRIRTYRYLFSRALNGRRRAFV